MPTPSGGREVLINGPDGEGFSRAFTVPGGQYFFPEMIKWFTSASGVGDHFPLVEYIDATAGVIGEFLATEGFQDGANGRVTFAVGLTRLDVAPSTRTFVSCPLPPVGLGEASFIQLTMVDGQNGNWGFDSIEEVRVYGYYAARDDDVVIAPVASEALFAYGPVA